MGAEGLGGAPTTSGGIGSGSASEGRRAGKPASGTETAGEAPGRRSPQSPQKRAPAGSLEPHLGQEMLAASGALSAGWGGLVGFCKRLGAPSAGSQVGMVGYLGLACPAAACVGGG